MPDAVTACCKEFGGRSITWTGFLEDKSIDDLAPLVQISFKEVTIDLGKGRSAFLDGVSLALNRLNVAEWEGVIEDSQVTFSATFEAAGSPFSAIDIKHLKSGESVILIGLVDAKLISWEPRRK